MCGVLWGSAVGIAVGAAASFVADRLLPECRIPRRWCASAGAVGCSGVGLWGASHQVTHVGLVTIVGLFC